MSKNVILFAVIFTVACNLNKYSGNKNHIVNLDTLNVSANVKTPVYHSSRKRTADLIHTNLHVSFDWEKQQLLGKALLTFSPYFYPLSEFEIDAKSFKINKLAIVKHDSVMDLDYTYDSLKLKIYLDKVYQKKDTFNLLVDYIAMPNHLPDGGSLAITSNKGLYFINPLKEQENKPQQIWTQGETESNSAWFPTIDAPNEKMTQEIAITVQDKFISLSNGMLISQKENGDGTRTDIWRQEQPHAPYLCMLAVGNFAKVTDYWHRTPTDSIEVSYYVEPSYKKYARAIFGNTPEMLSCFSKLLGVQYPWSKFSQIVVRDYVSGAMENTTCVVHGEFLQKTFRELLDETNEDVISHELFHHWFGDFVTCESWANIPLNESFATYGEYLWREYKYGREYADQLLRKNLNTYLMEARSKQVNLIRFYYDDREDMFDSHSYAKGGCILHMLRKYVGDDAFFKSLNYYLTNHAFESVEIHDLRLAFEKITGEDLNWFFNQWFMASGHPKLKISYKYDPAMKEEHIMIEQRQDLSKTPLYKLPVTIDFYIDEKVTRENVLIQEQEQEFIFPFNREPDLVNVDAEKMLLCKKKDYKSVQKYIFQYYHAPLYLDRFEAIKACSKKINTDSGATKVIIDALSDKSWKLKLLAMNSLNTVILSQFPNLKTILMNLASNNDKSLVRSKAINKLSELFHYDEELLALYKKTLKDSSYAVVAAGLSAIVEANKNDGLLAARSMEDEKSKKTILAITRVLAEYGDDKDSPFFLKSSHLIQGYNYFEFILNYQHYLTRSQNLTVIDSGIVCLSAISDRIKVGYTKYFIHQAFVEIQNELLKRKYKLESNLNKSNKQSYVSGENDQIQNEIEEINQRIKLIDKKLQTLNKESSIRINQNETSD